MQLVPRSGVIAERWRTLAPRSPARDPQRGVKRTGDIGRHSGHSPRAGFRLSYDSSAMRRLFRLRMRPGRAMLTASSDPERESPTAAGGGEEVVVSEETAAFLVRQRAAEIVEVIESGDGEHPST
jgi:hypothetical protein